MNGLKMLLAGLVVLVLASSIAIAGDFDWLKDLNVRAEADSSGFRAQIGARFKIGDAEVKAVIGNVERPADAYMVLRLVEMSNQPTDYVIKQYRSGKGWGALAKSLGIKPGSREFHALKQGHDLYGGREADTGRGKGKGKGKKNR